MRILVTGATGFVGQHVVSFLLGRGHDVLALARDDDRARAFDWFEHVAFISHDIHSNSQLDLQAMGEVDAVMHLAWTGLPNYKSLFHFKKNLPADCKFLKSMVEQGIGQILISGTCFEYGMRSGILSEEMVTEPTNPYALAKDSLRKYLQFLQKDLPFTLQWARLFYVHGSGQNPNSILAQLDRAIDQGENVFNMSGGEQLRDYLPIGDVARDLVGLVEHPLADGIFNICSAKPISIRRLVETHLNNRQARMQLNFGYYAYPDYEPLAFWGDNRKLKTLLAKQ